MGEHFLQWINIVDFKCFHNFEAKDFKRVNLISGKNNVGKTAFMEACFINMYSNDIYSMTHALSSPKHSREYLEIGFRKISLDEKKEFLESINYYTSTSNTNKISFNIIENDGIKEYEFKYNNKVSKVNINDFSFERGYTNNIKFLTQLGFTKFQLKQVFEAVQKKDKEDLLYQYINDFDNNVINFKIIGGDKPQCKIQDGSYRDINEFGDGLKHYISIICALYACENGQLFIDEIDNGIHYTQLENMWELILNISKEVNCQVFATTHSKECIESYARVAKKLEEKEITFIELGKNKSNEIKAITMDYDRLQNELENTNEVRGW